MGQNVGWIHCIPWRCVVGTVFAREQAPRSVTLLVICKMHVYTSLLLILETNAGGKKRDNKEQLANLDS